MARGKHKKAAQTRAAALLDSQRSELLAELEREQRPLAQAERDESQVVALEAQLSEVHRATGRMLEPEADRLRAEAELLASALATVRLHRAAVKDSWERIAGQVTDRLGGGSEGFEQFLEILSGVRKVLQPDDTGNLDALATERIQRARGLRRKIHTKSGSATPHARYPIKGLMRRAVADQLPPESSPRATWTADQQQADAISARVTHSHATELDLNSIFVWHPTPWIRFSRDDGTGMLAGLGFDTTAGTRGPDGAPGIAESLMIHEGMSATDRSSLGAADPVGESERWLAALKATVIATPSRLPLPTSSRPRHPRPVDAAALKHWYSCAAVGNWLRSAEDQDQGVRVFGEMAVAAASAAPFWVPPGQIAGYLNSEPLTPEDRADLRLPYAQVMLMMSDPLHIPAVADVDPEIQQQLDELDLAMLELLHADTAQGLDLLTYLHSVGDMLDSPPNLGPVLAARGALVEAVILTGDALGNPADRFAWCLAIPGRYGGVIARFVVPALISATQYGDYVLDMAALAAWADWHAPESSVRSRPDPGDRDSPAKQVKSVKPSPAASVRVLRVRTARPDQAGVSGGLGRTVAPHVRRGHWRRQRYGVGRLELKRVRIAPVLVNQRRGGLAPRVYRLPALDVVNTSQ